MSYKAAIHKALGKFHVTSPDKSNLGGYLADVYLWDTVADLAKDKSKAAWNALVSEKLIVTDDVLRETINGNSVPIRSDNFIIQVKVDNPRSRFDKDAFINAVATEFKISKPKLIELSKRTTTFTRAPLSKTVLEV